MSIAKWLLARKLAYNPPLPPVIKRVTGNPIEFTDGADAPLVKCTTAITGSQDLHGYDKPWVGGTGKNKLPQTATGTLTINGITFTPNDDGSVKVTGTATGTANYPYITTNASSPLKAGNWRAYASGLSNVRFVIGGSQSSITGITLLEDGYTDFTLANDNDTLGYCTIQVESGKTVNSTVYLMITSPNETSTFAPYSNICPITAYTEGKIEVRGKNLISEIEQNTYNANGTTYVSTKRCRTPIFKLRGGSTYVFSFSTSNTSKNIRVVYQIWANNSYTNNQIIEESQNKTSPFTITPQNDIWISLNFKYTDDSNITPSEITAQGEKGSTPTAYEAPNFTTHTTTYPSAIYRGSEDVVNGTVTKDWNIVDLGSLTWTKKITSVESPYFRTVISDYKYISGQANTLCSNYEKQTIGSTGSDVGYFFTSGLELRVRDIQDYTDATAFATAMSGVMLAYELATPTTSSVTPTNLPIKSLNGYSHIESSTGDMVIDYITDQYQNFVDTVENALPNTRKGGTKAMDIFLSLEKKNDDKAEVEKSEEKR